MITECKHVYGEPQVLGTWVADIGVYIEFQSECAHCGHVWHGKSEVA